MPNTINRDKLMRALDDWSGELTEDDWPIDEQFITTWLAEFKDWERNETIARAINDNRLAVKVR
ncbi:MAG: hypothetical protein GEU90_15430 [Gemmatimonas sp.]|nr:hypothetical protein [Gemmatimonas sp.]